MPLITKGAKRSLLRLSHRLIFINKASKGKAHFINLFLTIHYIQTKITKINFITFTTLNSVEFLAGGESRIRTHEAINLTVFKTASLNLSDISPWHLIEDSNLYMKFRRLLFYPLN